MGLWIEDYRPQDFSEIKGQKEIVSRIKAFVESRSIPHLLFSGPAGVGKTTLALVVAKKLFGDSWKENLLETNASDERGIAVVRETIKQFARTRAIGNFPFKIIYLDECDALTKDAQNALRRTMEQFSGNCRFILSCNYSSKIIDPIQSRCAIFRFKPLELSDVQEVVDFISVKEGLNVPEKVVKILFEVSGGDCRRVYNILQSCAILNKNITEELVYSLVSQARPKEIKEVLELSLAGNFEQARKNLLDVMLKHGMSGVDVIKQIQSETLKLNVSDKIKVSLIEKCGEIEFRMVEGSDEFIQLLSLLAAFTLLGGN